MLQHFLTLDSLHVLSAFLLFSPSVRKLPRQLWHSISVACSLYVRRSFQNTELRSEITHTVQYKQYIFTLAWIRETVFSAACLYRH